MVDQYNQRASLEDEYAMGNVDPSLLNEDDDVQVKMDVLTKKRIESMNQLEKLRQALASRMEMPFDPMLMKMAAGFLAPTKTGSFGESLGYAASSAVDEAEKERSRKVDVEKLQSELIKQQQAMNQRDVAMSVLGGGLRKKLGVAGGAPVAGQPIAGGAPKAPTGAPVNPTELMPPQQVAELATKNPNILDSVTITPEIIEALAAIGDKDTLNMALAIQKSQMARAQLQLRGQEVDYRGKEVQQKEFDTVERRNPFDPNKDARISIPRNRVAEFDRIAQSNDPVAMRKFMASIGEAGYFGQATFGEPTPTSTPVAGTPPAGGFKAPPTVSERENIQLTEQERIKNQIKQDEADRDAIYANQRTSTTQIAPNASAIYRYAMNPETAKAFGYFSNKGFANALGKLIQEGVAVGDYRINMPGFQSAMMQIDPNISPAALQSMYAMAQNISKLELAFSAALKGQGQVSDYERSIVDKLTPKLADTAKVAALKSEVILARTKMDDMKAQMFNEWSQKNRNGFVRDFEQLPEYKKLVSQYDKKLAQLQHKYGF